MRTLVIGLGAWCVISVPVGFAFGRVMRSRFVERSDPTEARAERDMPVPDDQDHRHARSTLHVA